jgi:anthranilate phosphoribosyltransferase
VKAAEVKEVEWEAADLEVEETEEDLEVEKAEEQVEETEAGLEEMEGQSRTDRCDLRHPSCIPQSTKSWY